MLFLTRSQIAATMRPADYLEAVEAGFRAGREGRAVSPLPMHVHGHGGSFHAKGASLDGTRNFFAIKINGNFPDNPRIGLPTIQGVLLLCDADTGSPCALMDSAEITVRRTAAATALAARFLARKDSQTLCLIGCGAQAVAQAEALAAVTCLERCVVFDIDAQASARVSGTIRSKLKMRCDVAETLREASHVGDIVVTCTTAQVAFLCPDDVKPGTFIAAVGADNPEKSEISPDLMASGLIVADILDQCLTSGDLHHAVKSGLVTAGRVHAELADLVTGVKPGRTSDAQIVIFDSTGSALQDVASAAMMFEQALSNGAGTPIDIRA